MNGGTPNLDRTRRTVFAGLVFLLTALGFTLFLGSYQGLGQRMAWGDRIAACLFPFLYSQIAVGFVLALFGLVDKVRGGDPRHVMNGAWREREESIPLAATAIVVPVFNEEVGRVARGIEAMWRSLEKTGQAEYFDLYLLSDSNDPDRWVEEECAWLGLCRRLGAFGKIFYRKRRHPINGKSGNVADFCRRWGRRYRYMVVLDADSVMAGPLLVRLVRAMEANPSVGLIQTEPSMVLGTSLLRRMTQFGAALCGETFVRGCAFFQTSAGSYWGHNAVLRLAPFMEHCGLPSLPVPERSQRHVLSHDTVEAALMQRAGYEVWVWGGCGGSYEEGPPNLTDTLKRDRRWCAGNLQHFWFLFARDIRLGNRLQIWIGLMAYIGSPVWLAFLVAGSCGYAVRSRFQALSSGPEDLGAADPTAALGLLALTVGLLLAPVFFGFLSSLPKRRAFGGAAAMARSALLGLFLSALLAPIYMAFHTLFVLGALFRLRIAWTTQNRVDSGLSWGHCFRMYGPLALLGLAAQAGAAWWLGTQGWWLLTIFGPWCLAPFVAWATAHRGLGLAARRRGWLLTPEESDPPAELRRLEGGEPSRPGRWVEALLSPYVHAVHLAMIRRRSPRAARRSGEERERLLRDGPESLDRRQRLRLLWNAEAVSDLHRDLWKAPDAALHPRWREAMARAGTEGFPTLRP